jgi:isoquinoline 1-oxidoreductase beta subunit
MQPTITSQSRRDFLKRSAALGGGMALAFRLPSAAHAQSAANAAEVTAWVVVEADDSVIIRVARSEMGQGSSTALCMLVAEELECDWSKVRPEFASPAEHLRRNRVWITMATGGSRAIRDSNEFLRKAGATAREMLVAAAAQEMSVPAAECTAVNGIITHGPSGRTLNFGKVAAAAAKITPPKDVALKDPKQWKLIGKPLKRFDIPGSTTGKTLYGIDVQVPGMVHASLAQCPVFGGRLKSVDSTPAMKMRGVLQVVRLEDAVAVVADNWWRANQALKALNIEWDEGGNGKVSSESLMDFFRAGLRASALPVGRNMGNVEQAFATAAKTVEAEYFTPYLNHATMEPQVCTAWVKANQVEVWVSSQNAEASLAVAAETAGVPLANVEVHKMQLGGGFGRRGAFQDPVRYGVLVAKAVGKPVKTLWSREEDMQHGYYRPASLAKMWAALDASGMPTAWQTRVSCPSILYSVRPEEVKDGLDRGQLACFADSPYAVPNQFVDYSMRNTHVPVGFWRSVSHSQNPFMRECFLDEIANAGGQDPYQLRRKLLANTSDPNTRRYLNVLDACAKAAGWGTPLPAGVHRGIAVVDSYGSYAAGVIECAVSAQGVLDIRRVVVAVDPGYVANWDSAMAQAEGNVAYGLTAVLWGENTIKNGRIEQSNFHDYRMMRINEYPKTEVLLVPTGGFWGGMGEPPLTPLAPALCNAIFSATGKRIRSLPLKNHDLRRA